MLITVLLLTVVVCLALGLVVALHEVDKKYKYSNLVKEEQPADDTDDGPDEYIIRLGLTEITRKQGGSDPISIKMTERQRNPVSLVETDIVETDRPVDPAAALTILTVMLFLTAIGCVIGFSISAYRN